MWRFLKRITGLDMGDFIQPYPDDSPAKIALREAIRQRLAEKETVNS